MNAPYIIIYQTPDKPEDLNLFIETVRGLFPSRGAYQNVIFISAPDNADIKNMFFDLIKKTNDKVSFTILKIGLFYASLDKGTWKWLTETFPNLKMDVGTFADKETE
jgi:hypothetical protein